MDRKRFEKLVSSAIDTIPDPFLEYIENVVFLVEDDPDPDLLAEMGLEEGDDLLGLYQGDPLTARGVDNWGMLPDQIILFQRPIERETEETGIPVLRVIRDTILHEVGHYFGFSEEDLERMGLE
jgi:predicted Zn-dependent protease with MMP-like domain